MEEAFLYIVGLLIAALGYFLAKLHDDHADVKRRLTQMEIDHAGQKSSVADMREAIREIRQDLKELPSKVVEIMRPYMSEEKK